MDDTIELAERAFREYCRAKHGTFGEHSQVVMDLSLQTSDEESSIIDELDGETLILVRGPRAIGALRAALTTLAVSHG